MIVSWDPPHPSRWVTAVEQEVKARCVGANTSDFVNRARSPGSARRLVPVFDANDGGDNHTACQKANSGQTPNQTAACREQRRCLTHRRQESVGT